MTAVQELPWHLVLSLKLRWCPPPEGLAGVTPFTPIESAGATYRVPQATHLECSVAPLTSTPPP